LLTGGVPLFENRRLTKSAELLASDIKRNRDDLKVELDGGVDAPCGSASAPIRITRPDGKTFAVVIAGPLEIDHPVDTAAAVGGKGADTAVIAVNELMVRGNLPNATGTVLTRVLA
jgi:hypothetical protein